MNADYSESEPFPMMGFSGSWLINEDWPIRGTAEAFSIDMNDTEGDFYNVRLECEYAFTENISIGAGYARSLRVGAQAGLARIGQNKY